MPGRHSNFEIQGSSEGRTLFPFEPTELAAIHERLVSLDIGQLEARVTVRADGRPQDPLTTLYNSDLSEWHTEAGRLQSPQERLFHQAGLLYGSQLAGDRYHLLHNEPLRADDPDAHRVALGALRRSYVGLDHDIYEAWGVEKQREMAYTGSDALSIVSASLYDHIASKLPYAEGMVDLSNEAFYRGMVDSVLYYGVYTGFQAGRPPMHH
jgi:hypothetical protein